MCMTKARYVILWLMVVLYGLLLCSCNHSEKAFTVNGLAVEKAELVHYMQENTAVVAAALEEEAGVDSFHDDFWLVPQNGVDTFSRLREYTTQQIVRQKVEQLCAKEQGIDTPLYYSDQLTEMKEQNRQRTSTYETGEVLYGPVERDFVTYFSEWYLDMKKQCRAVLSEKGTLSIAAGEIEAYYEAHRENFTSESREDAYYRIREYLLDEAYEVYIDTLAEQAKVTEGNVRILPEEVV